jgi:hypothetical protein
MLCVCTSSITTSSLKMLIVYTGLGCLWGGAGFALRVIRRLAELIAGNIAQRCDTVGFECWRGLFLDFSI